MKHDDVLRLLKSMADPLAVEGMARYGINTSEAYGISVPALRKMAKEIGRDHALAGRLWSSGIHEARILACFIDDPEAVTEKQLERWARGFDSWDVCDLCCANLFDRTRFAYGKAREWSGRDEEFVKRAAFALMASLAVHDKKADDAEFERFLPIIVREAEDERNFVKKAVNWALRQIGKRSLKLNRSAIRTAKTIAKLDSRAAKWVASDALKELSSEKVRQRLKR